MSTAPPAGAPPSEGVGTAPRPSRRSPATPYLLVALLVLPLVIAYGLLLPELPGVGCVRPYGALLALALPLCVALLFHHRVWPRGTLLFAHVGTIRRAGVGLWGRLRDLPAALRLTALALIIVGLTGPQSTRPDRVDVEGIDVMVALDLSNSMEEADLAPDRLTAAKRVIDDFVRRRQHDEALRGDRIGMVVFGRDAYTYSPLTFDYAALRTLVRDLHLGFVDGRGTAIGNAVGVALNRLRESDAKSKVIILLTDGDNNAGNISPLQAARFARTLGVKVYTILMGQGEGVVPFGPQVRLRRRYPVNPKLLEEIAALTGGSPYLATDSRALQSRFHQILEELERSKLKEASLARTPLDAWFLWPALVLLLLEVLLTLTRLRKLP